MFKFKVWNSIKQLWPIYKANFGLLTLLTAITVIVTAVGENDKWIRSVLSYLVSFLLTYVWIKYSLSLIDRKEYSFFHKKSFPTLLQYWNIVKTIILSFVIVLITLPLLLFPAFYISGRIIFAPFICVEKNQGAIKSISDSWIMTKRNGWRLFWKDILITLFIFAGVIIFGVGILLTFPIGCLVFAKLYRDYQSQIVLVNKDADENSEGVK
jgi:hypothetical protein